MNHQPQPNSMKLTLCSLFLKITSLIVSLAFYFGSSTYGQARDRNVLSPGPVRPGNLDYRAKLPQGYLKVYSVSDEFNDGAYYAHSSYAIYHFVIQAGQRTMSIWTSQKTRRTDGGSRPVIAWRVQAIRNFSYQNSDELRSE